MRTISRWSNNYMRTKGYPLVVLTLFMLLLGAWSSFALFRFLALNIRPPELHKDTMLVKLINGLPFHPDSSAHPGGTNRPPSQPVTTPTTGFVSPPSLISRKRDTTYLERPQPVPINANSVNNAIATAKLNQVSFPWWPIILVILILGGSAAWVFYSVLPYLSQDMQKDLDPPELSQLF